MVKVSELSQEELDGFEDLKKKILKEASEKGITIEEINLEDGGDGDFINITIKRGGEDGGS